MWSVTTLVFVHAHPDDEALLTSGTMARAAAEGQRVVLVVATDGAAGLTSSAYREGLADIRREEVEESARHLGVSRVVHLGYADSGLAGDAPSGFASASLDEVSERIRGILSEESANVVVGYDPSGGYGHPDHVRVHESVRAAARGQSDVRLFEATLPREPIATAVRMAAATRLTPEEFDPAEFARAWTPRRQITHRVDVSGHLPAKRASLAAHASQAAADGTTRTLAVLGRLPDFAFRRLLGTEYYVAVPPTPSR
ncbi:MAG: PIG-L family deacetylase [Actinobacteria bacterium]|nr:PIG-L family deacetylase [Actinomycetota bacterium]